MHLERIRKILDPKTRQFHNGLNMHVCMHVCVCICVCVCVCARAHVHACVGVVDGGEKRQDKHS